VSLAHLRPHVASLLLINPPYSTSNHEIGVQLDVLLLLLSPSSYPSLMAEEDYLRLTRDLSDYACAHGGIGLIARALLRIVSSSVSRLRRKPILLTMVTYGPFTSSSVSHGS
jgi:hypothetical protein